MFHESGIFFTGPACSSSISAAWLPGYRVFAVQRFVQRRLAAKMKDTNPIDLTV